MNEKSKQGNKLNLPKRENYASDDEYIYALLKATSSKIDCAGVDKPIEITREDLDEILYPKMYRLVDSVTGKKRGYIHDCERYDPEFLRWRQANPTVELFEMDKHGKIKKKKNEKSKQGKKNE